MRPDVPAVTLPFSQACENNKEPILSALRREFAHSRRILEIGSGTGQHAAFFAARMGHLFWQTSDLPEHCEGIRRRLERSGLGNVGLPLVLDVKSAAWPVTAADGIFTANTLHIMDWEAVAALFDGAGRYLPGGGTLCVYGPFHYAGVAPSPGNAHFDRWLRERDPRSGVRCFEAVNQLAEAAGLMLQADHAMPANNRLLCWRHAQAGSPPS